ncbi:restriction modification system DNA specificity domain-containing protein [Alteromonas mediterranea 615]|uniref:Restriction modification system DNA specificity domain-containing protein n=1 Tax=Alteromonas mediterranea 615 TaxID=1300253 RepID=S5AI63_9ALTE|nr:restriction modification system DNA specificity domain-containing protein [Alteromonas mediterranea 615]
MKTELLKKLGRINTIPAGWKLTTVGKVCKIRNDLRKPLSTEERAKIQGAYPYYGPTGVLDFIDHHLVEGQFALIGEDGDHFLKPEQKAQTLLVNGKFNVNNHAHLIQGTEKCSSEWFFLYFHHRDITHLISRQGASRYKLNKDTLSKLPILVPPLNEQLEIYKLFTTWDNAIEKTEALITAKEKQFEWLTSNLINRAGHKRTAASGLMTEVSRRNKSSTIERVLSVTNHSGFVLPEEQFERRVASANVSNYKVVEQGQYAYNPSRINVGSIARLDDWENGILSPMYVVFKLDTKKVCSDYFLHWVNSSEARQRIKNSAQGSVRETVSFKDLGAIDIPLPAMDVQKDVTYKLNLAQKEISLLKNTLEQYRSQKRGLMQKLLTGEWQVGSSQHLSEETYQEASA